MAIFDFPGTLQIMKDIGIVDFFLPFLLVFAIVFGILDRSKIFGENRHDINGVIAMVIGFIFGITSWSVRATQELLPWIGIIAVAILGFLILISMFYPDFSEITKNEKLRNYATILIAVVMIFLFLNMFGVFEAVGESADSEALNELIGVVIVLAIVGGGVYFVTRTPGGPKPKESTD